MSTDYRKTARVPDPDISISIEQRPAALVHLRGGISARSCPCIARAAAASHRNENETVLVQQR